MAANQLSTQSQASSGWLDNLGLIVLCLMPMCAFLGIGVCDIALSSIGLLFLLRSGVTKDWAWCRQAWVIFGALTWTFIIIRSPFAVVSAKASFHQALPFGRFIVFAAALQTWLLPNEKNQVFLLKAMTVTLIFIAINTLFSFVTGLTIFGQDGLQRAANQGHGLLWFWDRPYTRIRGINGKLNDGILMSWMAMPMLVYQFSRLNAQKALSNWFQVGGVMLLVMLAIVLTGERMAMLELGMGLLLAFSIIKPLRRQLLVLLPIVLVLCVLLILHNKGIYGRQVRQVVGQTDHFIHTPYGGILLTAWSIFKSHLWLGVGLKQYGFISSLPQYVAINGHNTHTQNLYLEWLTGTGIIGSALFFAMMGCWIRQFWQHRKLIFLMPILAGVLIAWFQRIWPIASTTSFFFSWGAITFWWMGAWALAIIQANSKAHSD